MILNCFSPSLKLQIHLGENIKLNKKVTLSLSTIWRHVGGVQFYLSSFLTSSTTGMWVVNFMLRLLLPPARTQYELSRGVGGPRASLDFCGNRKIIKLSTHLYGTTNCSFSTVFRARCLQFLSAPIWVMFSIIIVAITPVFLGYLYNSRYSFLC